MEKQITQWFSGFGLVTFIAWSTMPSLLVKKEKETGYCWKLGPEPERNMYNPIKENTAWSALLNRI